MTAGGVKNSSVLDELESHLREDVERELRAGVEVQKAFAAAVQKLGPASALRNEFKKSRAATVAEKLMIAVAVFVVAFGIFLSVVTLLFCYGTNAERLVGLVAISLTLGTACGWPAFVSRLPVIHAKRKLQVTQVMCLAAGFVLCSIYIQVFVHYFERGDGIVPSTGFFGIFFIALGFALAAGLDRAARKTSDEIRA